MTMPPPSVSARSLQMKNLALQSWNRLWSRCDSSPSLHSLLPVPSLKASWLHGPNNFVRQVARLRTRSCSVDTFLHRHGLRNSDLCGMCGNDKGTVKHLLLECEELKAQRSILAMQLRSALHKTPAQALTLEDVLSLQSPRHTAIVVSNALSLFLASITDSQYGIF